MRLTCEPHSKFLPAARRYSSKREWIRKPSTTWLYPAALREGQVSWLRLDNFLRWQPNDLCPIRGNRTSGCLGTLLGEAGEARGKLMWLTICGHSSACDGLQQQTIEHNGKKNHYECLYINRHSRVRTAAFSRQQLIQMTSVRSRSLQGGNRQDYKEISLCLFKSKGTGSHCVTDSGNIH